MKLIDKLGTGDVIYTSCVGMPFCYHLGIVVVGKNGEKKIFHNSPYIKNKYGGSVCAESYENFMKEREVVKVFRTHVNEERVYEVSAKVKHEVWDTFFFNCEDYILEVVEGHRRSDLRDAWKIAILGIFLLILID